MGLSASDLTKYAKMVLSARGFRMNRVNNIPVRRRKNTVQKGWADLQGYTRVGVYVACEIKTINDKLSIEQIERMDDIIECGGLAYICTEDNKGNPVLISFGDLYKRKNID